MERTQTRAVIAEPLRYRDRLLGVIAANREGAGEPFRSEDLQALRLLADHAAIAIEKAQLFQELNQSYANLQKAQDDLVRAEKLRALGQMSAGIAHDRTTCWRRSWVKWSCCGCGCGIRGARGTADAGDGLDRWRARLPAPAGFCPAAWTVSFRLHDLA